MGVYGGCGFGGYDVVVALINDPKGFDRWVTNDRGLWCAGLIAILAIRYPAGPYIPAFGVIGCYLFQSEVVEEEADTVGFARGVAGESIGGFEARDLIPCHIADLPDDMIPFVVAEDQRSFALLGKARREFFQTII